MIRIILTLLLILFSYKACSQQPSKYENNKYDHTYGWDTARSMTDEECKVLLEHKDTLLKILDTLRKHNKSRAYVSSIPKEVMNLEYTKQFIVKKTVPVFKLTVGSCPKEVAVEKTHTYKSFTKADSLGMDFYDQYIINPEIPCSWKLNETYDFGVYKIIEIDRTYQGRLFRLRDCHYTSVDVSFFISEQGICEAIFIKSFEKEECLKLVLTHVDAIAKAYFTPAIHNGELVKTAFTITFKITNPFLKYEQSDTTRN